MDARAIDWSYRLDDRYARSDGRLFMSGTQALVRLMLEQAAADRRLGLDTAGFVSGYRGSPLGGVDQEFWKAAKHLDVARVRFQPAINEDLAATAILGTQQVESDPAREVEGVFALWYGKGPGVDRAGDALKHGNAYGSSPHGGVLVVVGDDHGCVSSSFSHQSDLALMAWSMPVLHPTSIADYVPFGLYGFALSRFSGAWVGFKAISETVEGSASIFAGERPSFRPPPDFMPPPGGLHYRWPDYPSPRIEQRLAHKVAAVRAFVRANPIDHLTVAPRRIRLLIGAVGKAHGDVMEALRVGGLGTERLAEAGIAIAKIGLVFPVSDRLRELAQSAEEVLIVEEKAPVVENQLKELLYNLPAERRPRILGKRDEQGAPLIAADSELRPSRIAPVAGAAPRSPRPYARYAASREPRAAAAGAPDPHGLFLLRLPAQHLDAPARGQPRLSRNRLSLHGELDGPRDRRPHPDGRRGRELGRTRAVHGRHARFPEPRRRYLFSLGPHGDPPGRRGGRQRHLQDPVQ